MTAPGKSLSLIAMYLWDSNILRHFGDGHPTLRLHLERIPWTEIALPSVVVAEALRADPSMP